MEEIDLKELFDFIKSKIEVVIITTILICTMGCLYILFLQKPMYSAYTTVILSGSGDNNNGINTTELQINNTLVDTYANVVKSRSVIEQVIKNLKLDSSYEAVASKISVSAINKTQIIRISVSDLDPENSKNIANETAKDFIKRAKELYNLDNIGVLDEAIEPTVPYNINIKKTLIICFMMGIVLSLAILFMIFYFDRTIKSTEQIEQKVKLPILGSVQDFSSKKGGKK